MPWHTVQAGQTLATIALEHAVAANEIRSASENADLFSTRKPNVLFEGDELFIPDARPKQMSLRSNEVHTLVFRPLVQRFAVQFCRGGRPRDHEPIRWSVDGGETTDGHLDARGWFREPLPLTAQELLIELLPDTPHAHSRRFRLGHLDPTSEARGLQQRLNNVGFHCGAEDADVAEKTVAALEAFQQAHGLPVTGQADEATLAALDQRHGI